MTYRDLKEPEGWRSSSLRNTWLADGWVSIFGFCAIPGEGPLFGGNWSHHPACLERVADSISGVSIQGFLVEVCISAIS